MTDTSRAADPGQPEAKAADTRTVDQIEADIVAARGRLAGTVDELHARTAPQEIARRQVAAAKARFTAATRTETGELRIERIAAVAAAAAAVVALVVWRRRRG
jgi:hypothetical protein